VIRQTQGVYDLVEEILKAIPRHDEDTIEKVFVAIENDVCQLDRYRRLENELSHRVIREGDSWDESASQRRSSRQDHADEDLLEAP
jgi:hypothetical protein